MLQYNLRNSTTGADHVTTFSPETLTVIDKVKKLLALASNNPNENEASAASAKAMELLESYNLDMATIGDNKNPSQRDTLKHNGGLYGWQRELWRAVAELSMCLYWCEKGLGRGQKYQHKILGSHVNVVSATVLSDYLQSTVERLAKEWANDNGFQSVFVREAIAYREGMARRLVERLQDLRRERLDEDERKQREQQAAAQRPANAGAGGGTGLVLASVIQTEQDLNRDYFYGYEPGTTAARRAAEQARQCAARLAADEALLQRERDELANPALREERLAAEAKAKAKNDKCWENYFKRAEKRQSRSSEGARYRAQTAEEQRASMPSFSAGYRKGADIGLDKQVNKNNTKSIK